MNVAAFVGRKIVFSLRDVYCEKRFMSLIHLRSTAWEHRSLGMSEMFCQNILKASMASRSSREMNGKHFREVYV